MTWEHACAFVDGPDGRWAVAAFFAALVVIVVALDHRARSRGEP